MKVILLVDVNSLGKVGDICDVKSGYAKNYLLSKNLAVVATPANVADLNAKMKAIKANNDKKLAIANELSNVLNGSSFTFNRQAGDDGALYGSVKVKDIADRVNEFINSYNAAFLSELPCSSSAVFIEKPIKFIGEYPVRIILFAGVESSIVVNVSRSSI
jgi:large subunit ribosomal protein L9